MSSRQIPPKEPGAYHRMQMKRWWAVVGLVLTAGIAGLASCGGGSGLHDHLVLTRQTGLVERDLSSGDEHLLVPQPSDATLVEPAVSPDGTQIAYVGLLSAIVIPGQSTDLGSDIYIASADGSSPRLVAKHAVRGEQLHSPAWLPDGSLLIYAQRFENRMIVVDVERIELATGERTVVINDAFSPAPSPDGKQIVYIKAEPDLTVALWVTDADGSNAKRLVPNSGLVSFGRPRYSPDGRYLVLGATGPGDFSRAPSTPAELASVKAVGEVSRTVDRMNGLPEDIWLVDLQTGEARRLADLDLDAPSSAWSSDGQRIFVLGDKGLYEIDPNGGDDRIGEGMFHGQLDWLSAK